MAASISVSSNDDIVGFNIVIVFDSSHTTGTATVVRVTDTDYTLVRGMTNISYASYGPTYSVVDTEVGLDVPVTYVLVHTWGSGASDYSSDTSTNNTLVAPSSGDFVLRNLFLPADTVIKDVEVGTLQDVSINIRATHFSVLGRPDPVVIVDTVDSEKSTLIVETRNASEAEALRLLTRTGNPLVLQSLHSYGIGSNGLLYLQPTSIDIKRLTTFGKEAYRRFEINYVQVTPPIAATVFSSNLTTYATTASTYDTYAILTSLVPSYFELLYGYPSP